MLTSTLKPSSPVHLYHPKPCPPLNPVHLYHPKPCPPLNPVHLYLRVIMALAQLGMLVNGVHGRHALLQDVCPFRLWLPASPNAAAGARHDLAAASNKHSHSSTIHVLAAPTKEKLKTLFPSVASHGREQQQQQQQEAGGGCLLSVSKALQASPAAAASLALLFKKLAVCIIHPPPPSTHPPCYNVTVARCHYRRRLLHGKWTSLPISWQS
jgi:hypothetical protein